MLSGVKTTISSGDRRSPVSSSHLVAVGSLGLGQEVWWLSRRWKVLQKQAEGSTVRLKLKSGNRLETFRFVAEKQLEVFDRTRVQEAAELRGKEILAKFQPGQPALTVQGLAIACGYRHAGPAFKAALEHLVEEGSLLKIYRRDRPLYRLPLPHEPGLAVVENWGRANQRCGWIVEWKRLNGRLLPLVQWVEWGGISPTAEELLEPASSIAPAMIRIRVARQLATGTPPQHWVEVPDFLWRSLASQLGGRIEPELLRDVAAVLGYCDEDMPAARGNRFRNVVLDYLDLYYPGWRRGKLTFPIQRRAA